MSCDNIQGNGEVAAQMIGAFAALKDPELATWIAANVSFPSCMVDRITPQTSDEDRQVLTETFGVDDAWPVVCEPFTQWVLEDHFTAGRPPWEDAGVQVVDDVAPYELMKLRLLNASHQAMCYLGTSAATGSPTRCAVTRCSCGSCAATWTTKRRRRWRRSQASTSTRTRPS
jgi:mannitol 2-dehydrogenase